MEYPFLQESYGLLALDPVHIGTGGYRLGRVDNTILREPGTSLPKIPGTSLSGVLRAFMAMRTGKYPDCAGQGKRHCGSYDCPVCMSFGYAREKNSFQGLVQLSDACLLFAPVYSTAGPVWVTSPGAMENAGFDLGDIEIADDKVKVVSELSKDVLRKISLGWLLLEVTGNFTLPNEIKRYIPSKMASRVVLVSDWLFSHIVNDNLEVRTSVSIDPNTGAAQDKGLFTYEAIPRTALLHFKMTIMNPQLFEVPPNNKKPAFSKEKLKEAILEAAEYLEWLGIGGMITRGMGRMRLINPERGEG